MAACLLKIKEIVDALAAINEHIPESDLVMYGLNDVGREYDSFIISTQNRDLPITFAALKSRLIQHEQWSAAQHSDISESLDTPMNSASFFFLP